MRHHMWKHWVARSTSPHEPFSEFESARWFWSKLREGFPEMISAVLMPNHLHLILPKETVASRRLAGLLAALSVRAGSKNIWQPIPIPTEIPDTSHLRRQIRYLALNPCRKKLCKDPLEWYWSTYRDVMGASVGLSRAANHLASILNDSPKNFGVRFHKYVSGDPSVSVSSTPPPYRALPKTLPEQSIGEILAASSSALRIEPSQVRRRGPLRYLFVHLAYRHGWRRPIYLAQICGISPGAIHQIMDKSPPEGTESADLCLGDLRLRSKSMDDVGKFFMETTEMADTKPWSRRFL